MFVIKKYVTVQMHPSLEIFYIIEGLYKKVAKRGKKKKSTHGLFELRGANIFLFFSTHVKPSRITPSKADWWI